MPRNGNGVLRYGPRRLLILAIILLTSLGVLRAATDEPRLVAETVLQAWRVSGAVYEGGKGHSRVQEFGDDSQS
jgi:hypothetical protein